jgi:hypothetical protein
VTHGLGSESSDLRAYVVFSSGKGPAALLELGCGFLPSHYQESCFAVPAIQSIFPTPRNHQECNAILSTPPAKTNQSISTWSVIPRLPASINSFQMAHRASSAELMTSQKVPSHPRMEALNPAIVLRQ